MGKSFTLTAACSRRLVNLNAMVYRIYRTIDGIVIEGEDGLYATDTQDWNTFINDDALFQKIRKLLPSLRRIPNSDTQLRSGLLPPIDKQEIWASGVTYFRSREARMEESRQGGDFYDNVYEAERPELFYKANAQRTVGPEQGVNIRADSTWDVPEPELTLFISSGGRIAGYTIGNDMSSRSIEGENPLYLPQAKVFEKCAGLGPCLTVMDEAFPADTQISMEISRGGKRVFADSISVSSMKRTFDELVSYLLRACEFPFGCFLMTGTGIVPPPEFTLQSGDEIRITIDPIGTLVNFVN